MKLSQLRGKLVKHPISYLQMKFSEDGEHLYKATLFPFAKPPRSEQTIVSTDDVTLAEREDDKWTEDTMPSHPLK